MPSSCARNRQARRRSESSPPLCRDPDRSGARFEHQRLPWTCTRRRPACPGHSPCRASGTARKSEVEQPRAGRRGEAEDAEAREARPARELRSPLMSVKRNRVGRGVLRRREGGPQRERHADPQVRGKQSRLQVRARRLTIHRSVRAASAPMFHCEATRPASSSPTITLATALPTWSTLAQRAPRVEGSRTTLASETDTASIPIIVPAANDRK